MKTESILKTLSGLFGSPNLCREEDYKLVDTLIVSRMDYDGTIMDVDYNDLRNFPNLFNLTIDSCMIDNELINILSLLPNLRKLSIINCDIIEDIKESFSGLNIFDLYICNTKFDLEILENKYKRIILEEVPFKEFKGVVGELNVYNCDIKDVNQLLAVNFDVAYVSSKLYLTNQLLFDDSKKKIIVMEENGQFISKKVGF